MTDRFPSLRSQAALMAGRDSRTHPAPVDLTFLAALFFVVALALV